MIEIKELKKSFGGFQALDGLSLTVPTGSVYGLVGPNGAGKTTAIKHLTGVYRQDSGEVLLDGAPVFENPAAKEKIAAGETDSETLIEFMKSELSKEPMADIDYVEVVDGLTMQPIPAVREGDVIAMAVRIGTTRLIDNFIAGDPLIELG